MYPLPFIVCLSLPSVTDPQSSTEAPTPEATSFPSLQPTTFQGGDWQV